jgi:cytochrome oxidase Cu insertion factor (SCO1/SenC/PrrC family)
VSDPRPLPRAVVRRRRLQLVGLAVLFLGPLVLSALLYYGGRFRPSGHVQHGELMDPARLLPDARLHTPEGATTPPDFLHHKWSLLVVAESDCDARCTAALAATRVVRQALDADALRVQRVLLGAAGCCDAPRQNPAQADLVTAWLDAGDGQRLLAAFATRAAPTPEPGRIYLVDPLGNLVMSYAPGTDPKDLLKDLGRLLRLSQIG